jgi:hypothetical protein
VWVFLQFPLSSALSHSNSPYHHSRYHSTAQLGAVHTYNSHLHPHSRRPSIWPSRWLSIETQRTSSSSHFYSLVVCELACSHALAQCDDRWHLDAMNFDSSTVAGCKCHRSCSLIARLATCSRRPIHTRCCPDVVDTHEVRPVPWLTLVGEV